MKKQIYMRKVFFFALLIGLISCGPKSTYENVETPADSLNIEKKSDNESAEIEEEKRIHSTFNDNITNIPENLKSFIPEGYAVINISTGDANLDGLADKILVLRKSTEATTSNYDNDQPDARPLLLLLGQRDGSFKLVFRNDNAVYCIDCGGFLNGDPFIETTIKNGFFTIVHGIAGGRHWQSITTFKYNKSEANWFLYTEEYESYKMNDSKDMNAEALVLDIKKIETQKDFGKISFSNYNIYQE